MRATWAMVMVACVALDGRLARAEQQQAAVGDSFYRVNGLVEVYDFDPGEPGDGRFGRQSWTPQKPLEFEIYGTERRQVPHPDDSTKQVTEVVYVVRFFPIGENGYDRTLEALNADPNQMSLYVTSKSNGRLFWISKAALDAKIAEGHVLRRYRRWFRAVSLATGAALSLPFKLRPAAEGRNLKLETDVTLGGYLGIKMRLSERHDWYGSIVLTAGLVTLPVNSDNTGGPADATAEKTQDTTLLGITYGGALILDFDGFQAGFGLGVDRAPGEQGRTWIYDDRLWCSFSIGYTFFKRD